MLLSNGRTVDREGHLTSTPKSSRLEARARQHLLGMMHAPENTRPRARKQRPGIKHPNEFSRKQGPKARAAKHAARNVECIGLDVHHSVDQNQISRKETGGTVDRVSVTTGLHATNRT